MRALRHIFFLLLTLASLQAWAQDAETQLLTEVYATDDERLTLYCQTPFKPNDRIHIERVYPQQTLLDHFGCESARSCEMNADYLVVWNDLHQMFPITSSTSRHRRGTFIDDTRLEEPNHACGYKTTFQTFEPSDHAKGDIARAILYLYDTYKVPLAGNLGTLQEWNKLDPPDEFEKLRNQRIADIQGKSNPFIDNPELAEQVVMDLFGF